MDDKRIIALFLERSEQAVEAVSQKYGKLCKHLAQGIVDSEADAMECVNDAYMALWNTIPPEHPASLRAYLTKILRNIACNRSDPDRMLDSAIIREALNQFLRSQNKKDRFLFLRRYYYLDTCREIARMTGMSESAVSTRLGRLRSELKELLSKEGICV